MYIFIRKNGETFGVHLHTSSGQENKTNINVKRKERDLERVCHLGMNFRSIMDNGKEELTRRLGRLTITHRYARIIPLIISNQDNLASF